ncbi:MAG: hypothetical protein IJB85_05040 [Clostridia bacterium]|nr:hypothetical protein [Clostridia bacterium]
MFAQIWGSPYRFFLAAAVLAAILCLFPAKVDAPEDMQMTAAQTAVPAKDYPAGADLTERTQAGCYLHRTLYYAPCGHSVQSRSALPAQLAGMSRALLEKEIAGVIPGAAVTGFSASEVDIAVSVEIPCPLHWVLRAGEDGMLHVLQNRDGETLEVVRSTDVPLERVGQEEQSIREGRMFDDVQALEGYLESLSS